MGHQADYNRASWLSYLTICTSSTLISLLAYSGSFFGLFYFENYTSSTMGVPGLDTLRDN